MSRAFIKEIPGDEVHARRLSLRPELRDAPGARALAQKVEASKPPAPRRRRMAAKLRYWRVRLAGAVLVDNSKQPPTTSGSERR